MKFTATVSFEVEFGADTLRDALDFASQICYPVQLATTAIDNTNQLNVLDGDVSHVQMVPGEWTTVREVLAVFGRLKVYDTALPQTWYDEYYKRTGENPFGKFVWCYDDTTHPNGTPSGYPFPVTREAALKLDGTGNLYGRDVYRYHPDWKDWLS